MSTSQVVTLAPDGSQPRWLGRLGGVGGLKYSYACSGGADQMSCTLAAPADLRTDALNPGRIMRIYRGGSVQWSGKVIEPVYQPGSGWSVTGIGIGNAGTDYDAVYTTWTNQNDAVNQAITRGLPWINPGGTAVPGTVWLGQQQDSGSMKITDLLNLMCSGGGLVWQVSKTGVLSVRSVPVTPTRILTCTQPQPRTLGGDINVLHIRYQSSADSASGSASYSLTTATNSASVAAHGRQEDYLDLSSAGTMSAGAAQAVGNAIFKRFVHASFSGAFTVQPGELMTLGGQAVDLGCEQAGEVYQVIMTDGGYGGEVVPGPVTFLGGAYEFDDSASAGTVTPFQYLNLSVASIISAPTGSAGTARGEKVAAARARAAAAKAKARAAARKKKR